MEKYSVELLPLAWDELNEIFNYILIDSKKRAEKVLNEIIQSLKVLETFPNSSPLVPDKILKEEQYRMHICGKYICFYRVIMDKIYIYHIIHASRNYLALLKECISIEV